MSAGEIDAQGAISLPVVLTNSLPVILTNVRIQSNRAQRP